MSGSNDLSPWIHPKAKAWHRALFRRANLPLALEDELRKPDDQLNIGIVRMALAFAVMLCREEVWPEQDRDILKLILKKAKEFSMRKAASHSGKPLTISEHQFHAKMVEEMNQEMELLRRRLKMSNRQGKITAPHSWSPFWE